MSERAFVNAHDALQRKALLRIAEKTQEVDARLREPVVWLGAFLVIILFDMRNVGSPCPRIVSVEEHLLLKWHIVEWHEPIDGAGQRHRRREREERHDALKLGHGRSWWLRSAEQPMPDTVAGLRRAAAGVPASVPDHEIDRYIADILAAEARQYDAAYRSVGTAAYRPQECVRPQRAGPMRTNTRFLASMLRNADSHNTRKERESREGVRVHPYKTCMHGMRGACPKCERREKRSARRRGESPPR